MPRVHRRYRRNKGKPLTYVDIAIYAAIAFGVTWTAVPHVKAMMMSTEERAAIEGSVTYWGCNEVRAAGKAPLYRGQPGYNEKMDGDLDGIACEVHY